MIDLNVQIDVTASGRKPDYHQLTEPEEIRGLLRLLERVNFDQSTTPEKVQNVIRSIRCACRESLEAARAELADLAERTAERLADFDKVTEVPFGHLVDMRALPNGPALTIRRDDYEAALTRRADVDDWTGCCPVAVAAGRAGLEAPAVVHDFSEGYDLMENWRSVSDSGHRFGSLGPFAVKVAAAFDLGRPWPLSADAVTERIRP